MKNSNKIANFVQNKVNLMPNSTYIIYDGPNGLVFTRGSMEYRDDEHKQIVVLSTMDEAPQGKAEIKRFVEFAMNQQS